MSILFRLFFGMAVWLLPILVMASCPNDFFNESCTCNPPDQGYCIAAGLRKLTYFKMSEDLERIVGTDAKIPLKPLEGGSVINIKRMRWQGGVKFAILQSDILEFFRDEQENGNKIAGEIIQPLKVVIPLHNEELHLLVRADSDIKTFHDIKDRKIAVGPAESASATTAKAIYKYMFEKKPDKDNIYHSSVEDALRALAIDKKVDAWLTVSGQPAGIFQGMKAEAKEKIKLVAFDKNNEQERRILDGPYFESEIKGGHYAWLKNNVPTLAVKAFLITQKYTNQKTKNSIKKITQSICRKINDLKRSGHPKWKEVSLERIVLPGGWQYSDDALAAFESPECRIDSISVQSSSPLDTVCSDEAEILGLCGKK